MSDKFKKRIPWNKGKKCPQLSGENNPAKRPEVRLLLSEQKIGNRNPMFGKPNWMSNKKFPELTEENSFAWKGDEISYSGLHKWVSRKLGKPRCCEDCGKRCLKHRQYHWANISGNYKRVITDWRRLCVTCHKTYDQASH